MVRAWWHCHQGTERGKAPLRNPFTHGLLLLLVLAFPAIAQPTREAVQDARRTAEAERAAAADAARLAREAAETERGLARQRVAMAERVQQAEAILDVAQERERQAALAAAAAREEVARRAAALAPMMPAMRRLSLWPAETLLAVPLPPDEALRGVLVLQGLARQIRHELDALRAADQEAARRARIAAAESALVAAAQEEARSAARALDAEIAGARMREADARQAEREAGRRAQEALARASDLAEMLTRIEREQAREVAAAVVRARAEARAQARAQAQAERAARRAGRPLPTPPVAASPAPPADAPQTAAGAGGAGHVQPVAGRVLHGFGDQTEGGAARGLTIAAPAGARVVSPCAGRAVFSGPFRSYGLLLIVDCAEGHHVVLAGLGRLDTRAGARLLAGEPVGVMDDGQGGRRRLYIELRRNGQAVDPGPWLAGGRGRAG